MSFGLDNFGQGYTSLMGLEHLPLSWVKFDRVFFGRYEQSPGRLKVLHAMLGLARQFGFESVAKGVETEGELAELVGLNFDQAQACLRSADGP